MKRGIFLATGFLIGFLFWQILAARADNADIIINEIGASDATDYEWVEIWNKGGSDVDLTGWKFWENNTNHSLAASGTDGIVSANEYAVIVQDATKFISKYPFFSGSVFDSSWVSLNESGEEIGLKFGSSADNFIEKFTYPSSTDFSLERLNAAAPATDFANWCEHASGNTVGAVNSRSSCVIIAAVEPTTTPVTATTSTSTSTTTTTPTSVITPDYSAWQNLKLNEIVSDPATGTEQVEIFNVGTNSVDLSGGLICDNRDTTSTCKSATGTVVAGGFLVIDLQTASFLNNDGDSVILRDPNDSIIDQITYSGTIAPEKGESLALDNVGIWQITRQITLGAANIIVARPTPPSTSSGGGGGGSSYSPPSTTASTSTAPATTTIIINEIFPDPAGADNDDEFIEIYNFGLTAVDLGGWKIKDNEKSFNLSANLAAGGYLILKRPDTGIALNNTTAESLILADAWGREADKISYERAQTGESYNRTVDGWQWSAVLTPGAKNIIEEEDAVGLIWKISAPESGEVDEKLKFSALGSVDPRGGQLNYVWKFASGTEFAGPAVEYSFATSGIYEIILNASSSAGTSGIKKLSVKIGAGLSVQNAAVGITEIFPNPDGSDDAEYLELYNFGSSTVSLANWILRADTKSFEIPPKTNLAPNSTLVFYRAATKIALNNSGGKVSLLTPAGDTVDFVKYDKAISGKSFSLEKNVWQWAAPSPGAVNSSIAPPFQGGGEGVVAGVKISNSTKSSGYFAFTTIADARAQPKDAKVKVRGAVSVLPGIFGSQYFYISSPEGNGIQIYQSKKDFPELKIGNEIEVSGLVSEASGQKRVRATSAKDIKILGAGKEISPADIGLDELDENNLGGLVKITGDITEIKSNYMFVDNGAGEVEVFFKTGAKINKAQFKEGDKAEVAGILESAKDGFQVWPRSNEDIKVVGVAPEVAGVKIAAPSGSKKYILTVASIAGALGLGFLLRERGKVFEWLKRIFKA